MAVIVIIIFVAQRFFAKAFVFVYFPLAFVLLEKG